MWRIDSQYWKNKILRICIRDDKKGWRTQEHQKQQHQHQKQIKY
jgi:phosphatidate phosphatase APP1